MNISMMELSEPINKIPLCPKKIYQNKNTAKGIATQQSVIETLTKDTTSKAQSIKTLAMPLLECHRSWRLAFRNSLAWNIGDNGCVPHTESCPPTRRRERLHVDGCTPGCYAEKILECDLTG